MERTTFAGKALYNDTLRRREEILAKAAASVGHPIRSPRGTKSNALSAPSAPPARKLDDSVASVEHHYALMDKALLNELSGITREEMSEPVDHTQNRRMRGELARWVDQSVTRIGSLHHEHFNYDGLTPVIARKALKEGLRTPLELVRAEVRQRHPQKAAYPVYGTYAPPAAADLAARELPPMA